MAARRTCRILHALGRGVEPAGSAFGEFLIAVSPAILVYLGGVVLVCLAFGAILYTFLWVAAQFGLVT